MSQLIRLVYASRSTFTPRANQQGLDPGVARILAKSRKNNAQRQVVGGLLFGEGYFLQCLEGDADVVQALYDRIEADPRHREVTVLSKATITDRSFEAWSMKYVPGEQRLQSLLQQWGLARFDPYRLSAEQIEVAVRFMQGQADAAITLPADVEEPPPPRAQAAQPSRHDARTASVAGKRSGWIIALGALGILCAAAGYLLFK